jgi:hypothetical protein
MRKAIDALVMRGEVLEILALAPCKYDPLSNGFGIRYYRKGGCHDFIKYNSTYEYGTHPVLDCTKLGVNG